MKLGISVILFYCISCNAQSRSSATPAYKTAELLISLNNFPSKDTSAIIFYKKNVWFKQVLFKDVNRQPAIPLMCQTCDDIFSSSFFEILNQFNNEVISNDCTTYRDSIIEGKHVQAIQNFYNISDLQEESISLRYKKREKNIRYFEPRTAVKYCRTNKERDRFITFSNRLRNIL